jgi:hypothetical protein
MAKMFWCSLSDAINSMQPLKDGVLLWLAKHNLQMVISYNHTARGCMGNEDRCLRKFDYGKEPMAGLLVTVQKT